VTTGIGLDFYPALSPDGGRVAYASDQSGDFEIYVRQLAPGGGEIQITSDGAQNVQPVWSPDGQFVAFHSRRRGGVWVVPALGGVARRLTSFGSRPAWSRDGDSVAFQSAELTDLSGLAAGALPPSTLWVVPARGGEPRQLTRAGQPPGGHGSPLWTPDGRRVVFYSYDTNMAEIWSVAADAGDPVRAGPAGALLLLARNAQPFTDCVFAPDGRFAYCAGNFDGSAYGLWRVPVSPDTGAAAGEPVKVEGTGATPIRYLSISADGRRIAYSTQSLTSDIWSIRVSEGDGSAASAPAPLFEDRSLRKTNPSFSPDGRRIAFGVWRLGVPTNVWLMDADGRNAAPLTAEQTGIALPGWMPDGERVTYVSAREGGPKIWMKDLRTGDERPVFSLAPGAAFHRFSPDGRRIAYNSRADGATVNVWAAPLDGAPAVRLTSDPEMAGFPCWSPDGRRLAFEFKRGADTHIAVIPAEGGAPVQLTSEAGQSWPHSWSPDGGKIAFAGSRGGLWNVWWVSSDGREQRRLTDFKRPNAYVRYPAWSPRGDQIVFEYAEIRGNVWLLDLN
jgi:Tol biopolymer transport system component